MTLSMTAFARRDRETPAGSLIWELRSVNHRYLEVSLRLPEELRGLEPQVRDRVAKLLSRGKVDCQLRFQAREGLSGDLSHDSALLDRLLALGARVRQQAAEAGVEVAPLRVVDALRWPGVIAAPAIDLEALGAAALELLGEGLKDMVETRRREGAQLADTLRTRLDVMEKIVADLRAVLPEVVQSYRTRLTTRLAEVREQLDPARVEQEIVLFAQKIDVDEELDRLTAHIGEVRRVLGGSGQVGRRLDFLMQELNREANTLGAKAADVRLTNAAVDLKVLIEQMREQVQNIE
ncbi:MAG TPA: YicC/YloC family endoribonuclease [Acidiferrobacterales bacterium]